MTKSACIYERQGNLYVQPMSRTTSGLWVGQPPCVRLGSEVSAATIGGALLDALTHSVDGIPHPTDFKAVLAPLLAAARVRTGAAFRKGSRAVNIYRDDHLTLSPTDNRGKDGFVPQDEKAESIAADASASEIGNALLRALARCT